MHGRRSRTSGFNLLEVTLAAALLAVLAAIATPRFASAHNSRRLEQAARRIVADLSMAQAAARAASADRTVQFDPTANSYRISGVSGLDRSQAEYRVALGEEPYRIQLLSASFSGEQKVTFSGYGLPSSGGWVRIRLGDAEKTIVVDGQTGKATCP